MKSSPLRTNTVATSAAIYVLELVDFAEVVVQQSAAQVQAWGLAHPPRL